MFTNCYASEAFSMFGLILASWQIAIGTDDVYKTAEAVKLNGGKITREPGPLPGINTKITACLDPDGWKTVTNLLIIFSLLALDLFDS